MIALRQDQLSEFWLPCKFFLQDTIIDEVAETTVDTAHLLVSATTTLLRCTIEATRLQAEQSCADVLSRLIKRLQNARDIHKWDLADFCLDRCSEPVRRVTAAVAELKEADVMATGSDEMLPSSWNDLFEPTNSFDWPWDPLWDTFDDPMSSLI